MATIQFPISPLVYLPAQISLTAILVAFTSPDSFLRPLFLPILFVCNYALIPDYFSYITRPPWAGFVSGAILDGLLEYIEKVNLSQWNYANYGPSPRKLDNGQSATQQKRQEGTTWERLKFGYWVALSKRYIGSPYQARNIPPYSYSNPSYIPSRSAFLLKRASIFIICYLAIDIMSQLNQPLTNPTTYAQSHVPFFTRMQDITVDELVTRTMTTIFYWIGLYIIVQGYHSGFAFLSVASGFDRPGLWRPFNGPLSQAYTIRGFWGIFWHQFFRKKLTVPSRYITFHILHLPRSSVPSSRPLKLLSRYTQILLIFLLSGIHHQAMETSQGAKWSESGAVRFFVMMALGIALEDAVQWAVFDGLVGREKAGRWWAKAVGYVWVLAFMTYATPVWAYPGLRRYTGGWRDEILPFSIVRMVRG